MEALVLVILGSNKKKVKFTGSSLQDLSAAIKLAFRDVLMSRGSEISHLQVWDKDFDEFVDLDDMSTVQNKCRINVVLKNDETETSDVDGNKPTDLPKVVPYCTEPLGDESTADTLGAGDSGGQEGSAAYALESNLWIGRDRLLVYFLNSEVLKDNDWKCGKSGQLNISNILGWAEAWKPGNCPSIPDFQQTDKQEEADIRIKFADGGCWSRVGRDAELVVDKSEPTMVLSLKDLSEKEQKFFVRHEFGHALGLLHEHQRYDFWGPASSLLDVDEMRRDPRMSRVNFKKDIFAAQPGDIETEYDADSVMHYWFDVNWLKDSKYKNPANIESDKSLTKAQKMILKGIHKRNLRHPSGPSAKDLAFLQQHYSSSSQGAAGFLPLAPAGGTPSVQSAPPQRSQKETPPAATLESLMREYNLTEEDLDIELEGGDTIILAGYFDNVKFYYTSSIMGLSLSEQSDIKNMTDNQLAVDRCLSLWKLHNPSTATLRNLLEILIKLKKQHIASKVCNYYYPKLK